MSSYQSNEEKVDPRIKRTRALLAQAFIETLAEKGFQAVSVQDITEKAGVNRTTFYLHFPDKFALLDYTISQAFRQEIEKRMLDGSHFSPENLRTLVVTVAEFVDGANSQCARPEPQFESLVETQVNHQLQGILQTWLENTESNNDPDTAVTAASWAIYGLVSQWSHQKKRPSADAFADKVMPVVAAILGVGQPT
jgi:AcrR family transcriptional regulator